MKRFLILCSILFAGGVWAQRSPFTGREVLPPDSAGRYRIIFGGHFHGASNNRSGYPAATVLGSIDTLNALSANALFSTGDLFLDPDVDRPGFERSLFGKLTMAVFNAPGNHDLASKAYAERYGPTYGVVSFGNDRVFWLDTERDNGSILGDQLELLRTEVEQFQGNNLFIVAHRPLWAEGDSPYAALFEGNTRSLVPGNYQSTILPMLEQLTSKARVYWISGSLAGLAPSSIFFQEHLPGLFYIQCAVRDLQRDAVLLADVDADTLRWTGVSLTGRNMLPVEEYDAQWWSGSMRKREPFQLRLLPMYIRQTVLSAPFWYGAVFTVLVLLLLRTIRRRRS